MLATNDSFVPLSFLALDRYDSAHKFVIYASSVCPEGSSSFCSLLLLVSTLKLHTPAHLWLPSFLLPSLAVINAPLELTTRFQLHLVNATTPRLRPFFPLCLLLSFFYSSFTHIHPQFFIQKKMPFYAFQVRRRLCTISHHVFVSFSPSVVVFVSSLYVCLCICICVSQTVPGRPAHRLSVHMKCQFHHKPKWRTYRISFHKEGTRHRQRDKRGKSKENY